MSLTGISNITASILWLPELLAQLCKLMHHLLSCKLFSRIKMLCVSLREATLCHKKAIALSFAFYDRDIKPPKILNACNMGNSPFLVYSVLKTGH